MAESPDRRECTRAGVVSRLIARPVLICIPSPGEGNAWTSGETMGIKRVDDHHTITVVRMNGRAFGTSKATVSPDGKTITIENDYTSTAGGPPVGKQTKIWVRK